MLISTLKIQSIMILCYGLIFVMETGLFHLMVPMESRKSSSGSKRMDKLSSTISNVTQLPRSRQSVCFKKPDYNVSVIPISNYRLSLPKKTLPSGSAVTGKCYWKSLSYQVIRTRSHTIFRISG